MAFKLPFGIPIKTNSNGELWQRRAEEEFHNFTFGEVQEPKQKKNHNYRRLVGRTGGGLQKQGKRNVDRAKFPIKISLFQASQLESQKPFGATLFEDENPELSKSVAISDKRLLSDKNIHETGSNQNKADYTVAADGAA